MRFIRVGHLLTLAVLFAMACGFTGCFGSKKEIKLHQVSGTLTLNGKPVPGFVIHFIPAKGHPSTGISAQDGKFTLNFQQNREGVLPGEHKVWVEYRPKDPAEDIAIREGKSPLSPELQQALQKYGSVETTSLKITIDRDTKDLPISLDQI